MSASAATAVLCGSATWCRAVGTVPALRQTKLTEGLAPAQLVPRVALTGHFNTLGAHQRPHWVVRPWRALLCLPPPRRATFADAALSSLHGQRCFFFQLFHKTGQSQIGSLCWRRSGFFWRMRASLGLACAQATTLAAQVFGKGNPRSRAGRTSA